MKQTSKPAVSVLKASGLIGTLVSTALAGAGHTAWALGFALGSCLSVLSLVSLLVFVPMFLRPGTPLFSRAMLMLVMLMKLPVYALCLWLLSKLGDSTIFASIFGIALGPMVITADAVGELMGLGVHAKSAEDAQGSANALRVLNAMAPQSDCPRSLDIRGGRASSRVVVNGVSANRGVSISNSELASERV